MSASAKGRYAAEGALVAALLGPLVLGIVHPLFPVLAVALVTDGRSMLGPLIAIVLVAMGTWAATCLARRTDGTVFHA